MVLINDVGHSCHNKIIVEKTLKTSLYALILHHILSNILHGFVLIRESI